MTPAPGASLSLIHKNALRKGSGKRHGRALHPLPSVSASPLTSRSVSVSTDVEGGVNNFLKAQVEGFRGPSGSLSAKEWIRP
jgi:hypothetical protein